MSTRYEAELEEHRYFIRVLKSFEAYRHESLLRIEHRENCLATLPLHHKQWLSKYKKDLEGFKVAVEKNSAVIPNFIEHAKNLIDNYTNIGASKLKTEDINPMEDGVDKIQIIFKHLMRDWSSMGAHERTQCYSPILEELEAQFPEDQCDRSKIEVLVPGAGLGRLVFEIALRGFTCEGNEFNMYLLITSFFVLNNCPKAEVFEIYPWIHEYCNNLSADIQMTSVKFPDIPLTRSDDSKNDLRMIAGDFLEVYQDFDQWHCVATCFFIDCAPNVVQFIELIYNILKPGGVWINLGPLLYHYSDMKNEKSIEPSFEILCGVIKNVGFEMIKKQTKLKTRYCQNPNGMLQYEYESVYFVCKKPILPPPESSTIVIDPSELEQETRNSSEECGAGDFKIGDEQL